MLETESIFVTGGSGTLGMAIAERRKREGWSGRLTVYSTDSRKHQLMKRVYPDVNYVQGDIRNPETLFNAMVGHDICLHLAATKVIPVSEFYSLDTVDVNVNGSINVCVQAINAGIKHVLGVSTDKACHPANAYGATKLLMEKIMQEYSRVENNTQFHLVRYGNILESTGSVIESWKNSVERGEPIKITDPDMTRFFLSPQQAVSLVIASLEEPSGWIYIPKAKSLSIGKLAAYVIGSGPDVGIERISLRPGEKMHETLLTLEEAKNALNLDDHCLVIPSTLEAKPTHYNPCWSYTSYLAPELTRDELAELLKND